MNKLIFLGTGSGADVMVTQSINTSSLYFELTGLKFILDPGPGTSTNAKKYNINLLALDGVVLSHPHPDHCTDINAVITTFQHSGKKGFLLANELCLAPSEDFWPVVSKFHLTVPKLVKAMGVGDRITINNIYFEATRCEHYNCGMGFILKTKKLTIGYVGDGVYFDGQQEQYENCDILIFNVLLAAAGKHEPCQHMTVADIVNFVSNMKQKPELIIIQHFTEGLLKVGIDKQAMIIKKSAGIETIAAKDGMIFDLDKRKVIRK